ncbi:MAG: hypothetical protein J7L35_02910 [Anaerolineales bacterium]|nr:hypothetical protein [Anaerolineales bacterium]
MKKMSWIFLILVFSIVSCKSETIVSFTQESVVVGSQSLQLTFSSEQLSYGGTTALPTNLTVENQSDQPIYLPWGTDPGYNLIIVGLDSTYRTIFGKIPQTPEVVITDYLSIQPGEKIITEFPLPTMPEPGRYSVCAEILLFGNSDENQIYNVEFSSLKPKICIEVLYE